MSELNTEDTNSSGGTGNATNGKKKTKIKIKSLRYPKDRIENDMDYLRIKIAQYKAPFGGEDPLSAITKTKDKNGKEISTIDVKDGNVVASNGKTDVSNLSAFKTLSERTGTSSNRDSLKDPKYQIVLPIPQQLSDISAIDWTDGKLNPIEAYGLAATSTIIKSGGQGIGNIAQAAKDIVTQLGTTLKGAATNSNVQDAVIAAISGQAVGALGGNVSGNQIIARATGQVLNPNLELLFNGVNLRVFPFTFEFFPRNKEEAFEVKQIIKTFKYAMLPEKNGSSGIFISAPYIFQLEYMKGPKAHPFLNKFLPMALTNMSINYTGSNTYSTFYDGTPTHIRMELLFKELNPIYKEDYDELDEQGDTSVGY
jgi:hypothetical protein